MTVIHESSHPVRARDIDKELNVNRFGAEALAILGFTLEDPQVFHLMEDVLVENFTRQFGIPGADFVKACFRDFTRLPRDSGLGPIKEAFCSARQRFSESGLCYAGAKSNYAALQLALVSKYLNGRVVDVGANDNSLGYLLLELNPSVCQVVGTDIENRGAAIAGVRLQFRVQAIASQLPIAGRHADGIIVKHALHHMTFDEQEQVLRECQRCLTPDGYLVIYEDTYSRSRLPLHDSHLFHGRIVALDSDSRARLLLASFDIWPQVYKDKNMPFPSSYRTMEGWEDLFRRLGFEIAESVFYGLPDEGFAGAPLGVFILRNSEPKSG